MHKKISLGAAVALLLIFVAATFTITMMYSRDLFNEKVNYLMEREDMYDKFLEIDRQVRMNYTGTINEEQLMESVAQGYVAGIGDPYAVYLTAEEYQKRTQGIQGENVGIGAVLDIGADGYLVVREVYAESPAQVHGIEEGDRIVKIEDNDLTVDNSAAMLLQVTGAPGTKISLVVRKGTEDVPMELTRRTVVTPGVSARLVEDTSVGYIRIQEFNDNTSDYFNRELQKLLSVGASSLVLDLRDTGGGNMKSAARILDRLLPQGNLFLALYRGDTAARVLYSSDSNELDLPLVAITNEGTSNLAELFVQAIKDYNRGPSVGALTAGNGVMLDTINLSDGSAIELTTAYYVTPAGELIDGVGVRPDYEVTQDGDWTALDESTDTQLIKAIEIAQAMDIAAEAAPEEEESEPEQESAEEPVSQPQSSSQGQSESGEEDSGPDEPEDATDGEEPDEIETVSQEPGEEPQSDLGEE